MCVCFRVLGLHTRMIPPTPVQHVCTHTTCTEVLVRARTHVLVCLHLLSAHPCVCYG